MEAYRTKYFNSQSKELICRTWANRVPTSFQKKTPLGFGSSYFFCCTPLQFKN